MYTESDLVRIAQRENNRKRNYLVVNPLQGKHIPVSPGKALNVFSELAKLLWKYRNERILMVGFAETATAIGAELAMELGADYIQTTREKLEDVNYLFFSEEHSHATEQKLVKDDMDESFPEVDRIVFVDDEITTGKTIWNILSAMDQCYGGGSSIFDVMKFSVVSLLNGMSEETMALYDAKGIGVHYLVKTQHTEYAQIADRAENNGIYHQKEIQEAQYTACFEVGGWVNCRRLTSASKYEIACGKFYEEIRMLLPLAGKKSILILGTEEFMFPGLYVGKRLEEEGFWVKFHATTRSPIVVSREREYPLHERYELSSFYEKDRTIYLYDIQVYDVVIIITDAWQKEKEGELSLLNAVRKKNETVYLVRWCQK